MRGTISVSGVKEATKELNRRMAKVGEYTPKAFTDVVLDCLGKSVERAPVDTGDLRGSGSAQIEGVQVGVGREDGNIHRAGQAPQKYKMDGIVGFSAPYALRQHEELDYAHPQGGQAKYLESVVKENTDRWIEHLADSVKRAVR